MSESIKLNQLVNQKELKDATQRVRVIIDYLKEKQHVNAAKVEAILENLLVGEISPKEAIEDAEFVFSDSAFEPDDGYIM